MDVGEEKSRSKNKSKKGKSKKDEIEGANLEVKGRTKTPKKGLERSKSVDKNRMNILKPDGSSSNAGRKNTRTRSHHDHLPPELSSIPPRPLGEDILKQIADRDKKKSSRKGGALSPTPLSPSSTLRHEKESQESRNGQKRTFIRDRKERKRIRDQKIREGREMKRDGKKPFKKQKKATIRRIGREKELSLRMLMKTCGNKFLIGCEIIWRLYSSLNHLFENIQPQSLPPFSPFPPPSPPNSSSSSSSSKTSSQEEVWALLWYAARLQWFFENISVPSILRFNSDFIIHACSEIGRGGSEDGEESEEHWVRWRTEEKRPLDITTTPSSSGGREEQHLGGGGERSIPQQISPLINIYGRVIGRDQIKSGVKINQKGQIFSLDGSLFDPSLYYGDILNQAFFFDGSMYRANVTRKNLKSNLEAIKLFQDALDEEPLQSDKRVKMILKIGAYVQYCQIILGQSAVYLAFSSGLFPLPEPLPPPPPPTFNPAPSSPILASAPSSTPSTTPTSSALLVSPRIGRNPPSTLLNLGGTSPTSPTCSTPPSVSSALKGLSPHGLSSLYFPSVQTDSVCAPSSAPAPSAPVPSAPAPSAPIPFAPSSSSSSSTPPSSSSVSSSSSSSFSHTPSPTSIPFLTPSSIPSPLPSSLPSSLPSPRSPLFSPIFPTPVNAVIPPPINQLISNVLFSLSPSSHAHSPVFSQDPSPSPSFLTSPPPRSPSSPSFLSSPSPSPSLSALPLPLGSPSLPPTLSSPVLANNRPFAAVRPSSPSFPSLPLPSPTSSFSLSPPASPRTPPSSVDVCVLVDHLALLRTKLRKFWTATAELIDEMIDLELLDWTTIPSCLHPSLSSIPSLNISDPLASPRASLSPFGTKSPLSPMFSPLSSFAAAPLPPALSFEDPLSLPFVHQGPLSSLSPTPRSPPSGHSSPFSSPPLGPPSSPSVAFPPSPILSSPFSCHVSPPPIHENQESGAESRSFQLGPTKIKTVITSLAKTDSTFSLAYHHLNTSLIFGITSFQSPESLFKTINNHLSPSQPSSIKPCISLCFPSLKYSKSEKITEWRDQSVGLLVQTAVTVGHLPALDLLLSLFSPEDGSLEQLLSQKDRRKMNLLDLAEKGMKEIGGPLRYLVWRRISSLYSLVKSEKERLDILKFVLNYPLPSPPQPSVSGPPRGSGGMPQTSSPSTLSSTLTSSISPLSSPALSPDSSPPPLPSSPLLAPPPISLSSSSSTSPSLTLNSQPHSVCIPPQKNTESQSKLLRELILSIFQEEHVILRLRLKLEELLIDAQKKVEELKDLSREIVTQIRSCLPGQPKGMRRFVDNMKNVGKNETNSPTELKGMRSPMKDGAIKDNSGRDLSGRDSIVCDPKYVVLVIDAMNLFCTMFEKTKTDLGTLLRKIRGTFDSLSPEAIFELEVKWKALEDAAGLGNGDEIQENREKNPDIRNAGEEEQDEIEEENDEDDKKKSKKKKGKKDKKRPKSRGIDVEALGTATPMQKGNLVSWLPQLEKIFWVLKGGDVIPTLLLALQQCHSSLLSRLVTLFIAGLQKILASHEISEIRHYLKNDRKGGLIDIYIKYENELLSAPTLGTFLPLVCPSVELVSDLSSPFRLSLPFLDPSSPLLMSNGSCSRYQTNFWQLFSSKGEKMKLLPFNPIFKLDGSSCLMKSSVLGNHIVSYYNAISPLHSCDISPPSLLENVWKKNSKKAPLGVYFKCTPDHPIMDMVINRLCDALSVCFVPPVELCKISFLSDSHFVRASLEVRGAPLSTLLHFHPSCLNLLDRKHHTGSYITSLVASFADASPQNYIVEFFKAPSNAHSLPSFATSSPLPSSQPLASSSSTLHNSSSSPSSNIFLSASELPQPLSSPSKKGGNMLKGSVMGQHRLVDYDESFCFPVVRIGDKHAVSLVDVSLFVGADWLLDLDYCTEMVSQGPEITILKFVWNCFEEQRKLERCVDRNIFSARLVNEFSLRVEFYEGCLVDLYRRLRIAHKYAKKRIAGEEITHWDLFRATHPIPAAYYETILLRSFGNISAAFRKISSDKTTTVDSGQFIEEVLGKDIMIRVEMDDGSTSEISLEEELQKGEHNNSPLSYISMRTQKVRDGLKDFFRKVDWSFIAPLDRKELMEFMIAHMPGLIDEIWLTNFPSDLINSLATLLRVAQHHREQNNDNSQLFVYLRSCTFSSEDMKVLFGPELVPSASSSSFSAMDYIRQQVPKFQKHRLDISASDFIPLLRDYEKWKPQGGIQVNLVSGRSVDVTKFESFETIVDIDWSGSEPLFFALLERNPEWAVASLIDGRTLLHVAAAGKQTPSIIPILIHFGASVDTSEGVSGCTPAHVAVESGRICALQLLLGLGANINRTNAKGHSVFEVALRFSPYPFQTLEIIIQHISIMNQILANNCSNHRSLPRNILSPPPSPSLTTTLNQTGVPSDSSSSNPLSVSGPSHLSVPKGGIDLSLKPFESHPPSLSITHLHKAIGIAIKLARYELVFFLCEIFRSSLDFSYSDDMGNTFLHFIASSPPPQSPSSYTSLQLFNYFVSLGFDKTQFNTMGQTPAMILEALETPSKPHKPIPPPPSPPPPPLPPTRPTKTPRVREKTKTAVPPARSIFPTNQSPPSFPKTTTDFSFYSPSGPEEPLSGRSLTPAPPEHPNHLQGSGSFRVLSANLTPQSSSPIHSPLSRLPSPPGALSPRAHRSSSPYPPSPSSSTSLRSPRSSPCYFSAKFPSPRGSSPQTTLPSSMFPVPPPFNDSPISHPFDLASLDNITSKTPPPCVFEDRSPPGSPPSQKRSSGSDQQTVSDHKSIWRKSGSHYENQRAPHSSIETSPNFSIPLAGVPSLEKTTSSPLSPGRETTKKPSRSSLSEMRDSNQLLALESSPPTPPGTSQKKPPMNPPSSPPILPPTPQKVHVRLKSLDFTKKSRTNSEPGRKMGKSEKDQPQQQQQQQPPPSNPMKGAPSPRFSLRMGLMSQKSKDSLGSGRKMDSGRSSESRSSKGDPERWSVSSLRELTEKEDKKNKKKGSKGKVSKGGKKKDDFHRIPRSSEERTLSATTVPPASESKSDSACPAIDFSEDWSYLFALWEMWRKEEDRYDSWRFSFHS